MAYKGTFNPQHKEKYKGRWDKITYRSSWEAYLMKWCDMNPNVKRWNSEEIVIPYFSEADGKQRRYFMDFYVEMTDGQVFLFEVKPEKETRPPVAPKKMTAKSKQLFEQQIYTFKVNTDKWKAAVALCAKQRWQFKIITERTLKRHFGWRGG